MNEVKEKKKIGLTTKIFIALIAGAIVGIALNMFAADVDFVQNVLVNGIFYVVGQGFIRLMQMLVVPLVFCSLICGATAIGDSKTLGKVGVKISRPMPSATATAIIDTAEAPTEANLDELRAIEGMISVRTI